MTGIKEVNAKVATLFSLGYNIDATITFFTELDFR